jgi:3',5'-cyclic AMP phosphodiesterase CpdA
MAAPTPRLLASILHLSDLHLGEHFDYPDDLWKQLGGAPGVGYANPDLKRRIDWHNLQRLWQGMTAYPHDRTVLRAVFRGVEAALLQVQDRDPVPEFDLAVVTGDLLTEPFSQKSYDEFAYRWLTERFIDPPHNQLEIGLELSPDRLVVIPGNHDRFHQAQATTYEQSLFFQSRLPARTALKRTHSYYCRVVSHAGVPLRFIGVDTNKYGNASTLAQGELEKPDVDEIVDCCRDAQKAGEIAIVGIHHTPYALTWGQHGLVNAIGKHLRRVRFSAWDMEMLNAESFRPRVSPAANLVLFGHLHFFEAWQEPGQEDKHAVFAQAPSPAEMTSPFGFNVYLLLQEATGRLAVEIWRFTCPKGSLSFRRVDYYPQTPLWARPPI